MNSNQLKLSAKKSAGAKPRKIALVERPTFRQTWKAAAEMANEYLKTHPGATIYVTNAGGNVATLGS